MSRFHSVLNAQTSEAHLPISNIIHTSSCVCILPLPHASLLSSPHSLESVFSTPLFPVPAVVVRHSLNHQHLPIRGSTHLEVLQLQHQWCHEFANPPLPWWGLHGRGSSLIRFGLAHRCSQALPLSCLHTSPHIVTVHCIFPLSCVFQASG